MTKKYKLPEEEPATVNEPTLGYNTDIQHQEPCVFTPEEIEEQIARGRREKEAGLGTPHEELKKRFGA